MHNKIHTIFQVDNDRNKTKQILSNLLCIAQNSSTTSPHALSSFFLSLPLSLSLSLKICSLRFIENSKNQQKEKDHNHASKKTIRKPHHEKSRIECLKSLCKTTTGLSVFGISQTLSALSRLPTAKHVTCNRLP